MLRIFIFEGGEIYRIEAYGENFEIGDYPPVALEDFTVAFRIRRNPQSPWQTITVDYTIQSYKIFVQNWQAGDYLTTYSPGQKINLIHYYHSMLPQEGPLKTLFLGWSLDGKTAVNPSRIMPAGRCLFRCRWQSWTPIRKYLGSRILMKILLPIWNMCKR